jgi:addiction module HigA family antidote
VLQIENVHQEQIMRDVEAVSPGELLKSEFLELMRLSPEFLAREIGVSTEVIEDIVAGKGSVSADIDLRLCRFFGLSDGYWLRAQMACDADVMASIPLDEDDEWVW